MRLKSLKLAGFKSFANPTTFCFRQGITAIVGPNGCGKSNVIDAIRWVLGESSAKQLRSGAMSDVIFAGTQDKSAKSFASVELTFEHTQNEQTGIRHALNLYHELSVRRQVTIDGKSDYFINGTRCRRRDVVDVFLGTGLGPRSYSVIQQGMIGRIVDSNPMQLREFIEEAAGVSRYQARREETQKKLIKTHENLERLNDIEAELVRQKKKLEKQAASATNYQQTQEALAKIKEELAMLQLYHAKTIEKQHKAEQKILTLKIEKQQQSITTLKQKLTSINERLNEEQWLKDKARDKLHEHELQRQQAQHRLDTLQSSLTQLQDRLQANHMRQQKNLSNVFEFEKQLEQYETTLAQWQPEIKVLQQSQQQAAADMAPLQTAWEAINQKVTFLTADKRALEQQIAMEQQAQISAQKELEKWSNKQAQWQSEAQKWGVVHDDDANNHTASTSGNTDTEEPLDLDVQIANIDKQLQRLDQKQDTLEESLEVEQPALYQMAQSLTEQQQQFDTLEKQHTRLMAEYNTLHRIVHPPKAKPTKNLIATGQTVATDIPTENSDLAVTDITLDHLPTLSDTLKLSQAGEPYAPLLDKWLAFWLNAKVLEVDEAIDNMDSTSKDAKVEVNALQILYARLLQGNDKNRQTHSPLAANSFFFTLSKAAPAMSAANTDTLNTDKVNSATSPFLVPLSRLISAPKLAIWQQGYVLDNSMLDSEKLNSYGLDTQRHNDADRGAERVSSGDEKMLAAQLLNHLPKQAFIITHTGWWVGHSAAVHLSQLDTKGNNEQFLTVRLQQNQRLAALEDELNDIESQMDTFTDALKVGHATQASKALVMEELGAQLTAITHDRHELKQQRLMMSNDRDRQLSEQKRIKAQRYNLDLDYQEIQQSLEQLNQRLSEATDQLASYLPELQAAKSHLKALDNQKQQLSQQEREQTQRLQQLQLKSTQETLAKKHISEQLAQCKSELQRLKAAEQKLDNDYQAAQSKLPQQKAHLKEMLLENEMLKTELEERNTVIHDLKKSANELQTQYETAQQTLQTLQAQLSDSRTQVAIANERIKEACDRLTALNPTCEPQALLNEFIAYGRPVSKIKQQQLQADEKTLSETLQGMGPVNLAAAAELAKVDERLLPLTQQMNDISASMAILTDAITSIDSKTKALFMETLTLVNVSLTQLFTKVFGGGQASLTLVKEAGVDKSDQWRAGLELMAQPKGKKNSRLAVLSGGEKTLTALSLIFAIFKQHPAPFCVLDEVDAPLDDANVTRFTNLIEELAADVQFVFISHNKLAMQIADELKGITMPQAGVSTLVSVSLEEAAQYIEA